MTRKLARAKCDELVENALPLCGGVRRERPLEPQPARPSGRRPLFPGSMPLSRRMTGMSLLLSVSEMRCHLKSSMKEVGIEQTAMAVTILRA